MNDSEHIFRHGNNDYGKQDNIVTIFVSSFPGHPTLRIQDMVESMLHFSGGWVAEDSNENRHDGRRT